MYGAVDDVTTGTADAPMEEQCGNTIVIADQAPARADGLACINNAPMHPRNSNFDFIRVSPLYTPTLTAWLPMQAGAPATYMELRYC